MTASATSRAREIFHDALERFPADQRPAFLDSACQGDTALRQQVERLLAAHNELHSFMGEPAAGSAATIDLPKEHVGVMIGPYKLLEQIGEGGMGLVYMAEQQQPVKRLVALKLVKPGMDSNQVIARFEAERQALAMMDHPNIARILDAGTVGVGPGRRTEPEAPDGSTDRGPARQAGPTGRPYFVMELVRGIPINEFCEQQKLTVRQRLELFVQVCQAVQHAHQKGIIHRDLKPTNVLVTMNDVQPVPRVIDFGIAKALNGLPLPLGEGRGEGVYTGFAQLVGTPLYMSPEQAQMNQLGVDTRSDVYSLGVLLYELLTGTTPFDKDRLKSVGFDEMRRIIREEEPETVSARIAKTKSSRQTPSAVATTDGTRSVPTTTSELDWIVMKALEKDRTRRYESASALAADLQRYLSDEPVLACPPTAMYRFQKFARKHKPALVTAAAIALCLLLGTTVSAWQAVRATSAEAEAETNAQKADEKAKEATKERDEAQKQRDEVKALADKLAAKEQELERTLYAAHMNLANNAWNLGNLRQVNDLIEQHRPQPGDRDLRGFEWHYLYKLCHPELLTLKGHNVVYSPDGTRLAFSQSTWDETKNQYGASDIKVCDSKTGRELVSCQGKAAVLCLAFSPDGRRLASAGGQELKVWDTQTGKETFDLKGHVAGVGVMCVAFSSDGKLLASGGSAWRHLEDKWDEVPSEVKIWNASTGEEVRTIRCHASDIYGVAFSPDGERVVSGHNDGKVRIWTVKSAQGFISFKANTFQVANVVYSPDGTRLATSGYPGAKIWDAESGRELLAMKGLTGQTNSVAFSPDGKRLVTTGPRRTVQLWDTQTGDELLILNGHNGAVSQAVFNHDGTRIASASRDGTIRIFNATSVEDGPKFKKPTGAIRGVKFSPDGQRVAFGTRNAGDANNPNGDGTVIVCDAHTGEEIFRAKGHASAVNSVAYSPDGKRLASASSDKTVKIWDALTGRELLTLTGHTAEVVSVIFSPDGTRLASSSSKTNGGGNSDPAGEVRVWSITTGDELLTLHGHKRFVDCVAYSPDGKRLATYSRDNTLKIWDAQTGKELLSLSAQANFGGNLAFSPDGKRIAGSNKPPSATPAEAGEVRLWDAETGKLLFTLQGHSGWVTSVVFSPDSKRLASGTGGNRGMGQGREVKLWDVESGNELISLEKVGGGGVAFSPDGNRLVTAGADGVKIYDATPLPVKP